MAAKPPKPPDAFLSYTRFNDQHDGGAISEFCRRLASAVQAVTGVPFEIFQDVGGIGIGERWPGKLDQMLDDARFFIPIITPSYFTSKPCREELEKFLLAEAECERNDLVLPIYYIESEVLEDDDLRAADPLARTLHERQRQDWRELRFEPFEAKEVRRALEGLAREIVKARRRSMPQRSEGDDARSPERRRTASRVQRPTKPLQRFAPSSRLWKSPKTFLFSWIIGPAQGIASAILQAASSCSSPLRTLLWIWTNPNTEPIAISC
jgi:TIR domain